MSHISQGMIHEDALTVEQCSSERQQHNAKTEDSEKPGDSVS